MSARFEAGPTVPDTTPAALAAGMLTVNTVNPLATDSLIAVVVSVCAPSLTESSLAFVTLNEV